MIRIPSPFLVAALAGLSVSAVLAPVAAQTAGDRPNIILFLMDDMGINDIGAYTYPDTSNPYPASGPPPLDNSAYSPVAEPNSAWDAVAGVSRTPNIDSLAADGARLTSFYAASPVCSPSRSALMTGSYPLRVDINFVYFPDANNGLNPDEITLPELLKLRGYGTCMVGKWHLGDRKDFIPTRHGFDRYRGLLYSNDMWVGNDGTSWPDLNLMDEESPAGPITTATGGSIVNPVTTGTEQSYMLEAMTETSLEFIDQQHAAGEPFFLYYSPHAPHTPCYPHPDFAGSTGLGSYYDVVAELDHRVGQILDKLDDLGIAGDTLVIFTSDNGPWITRYGSQTDDDGILKRELPENLAGSAYPFRGFKHETWEGGQRVPFLARFPSVIPAGLETDEVAVNFDLYTTLAAWAGAPLPDDGRVIDGSDIRPILTAPGFSPHDFFVYYDSNNSTPQAIRDDDWKLRFGKLYDFQTEIQESVDVNNPTVESTLGGKMSSFDSSLKANDRSRANSSSVAIELSTNTVHVPEGGTASIDVWLSAGSNTTVTVSFFMGDTDLTVQSGQTLTFTSSSYATPQTVTFEFAGDADLEDGAALFRADSPATNLREIFVLEEDTGDLTSPGVIVSESGSSTDVSEDGATDSYEIVLQSQPAADVTVTVTPDIELLANGTAASSTLTFTPSDWDTPQTVTVGAVDDFSPEGTHTGVIAHTTGSADPDYDFIGVGAVTASVTDNDTEADAPDAPDVAADLVLWLKEADFLYASGTWSDSSSLGNDVSEITVGGGYGGGSSLVTLSPSGGLFTGESIPAVRIADNGLMGDLDLLSSGNSFSDLTLVAIYRTSGGSGETRAVGIGSKTYAGSGSGRFNLGSDASLRYDDGNNLGTAANHGDNLLLRASRLDSGTVTDWIDNGGGLVQNIAPTSSPSGGSIPNPTSTDAFFMGEIATSVGSTDPSTSDYDIVQVAVYQAALSEQRITDLAAWMTEKPAGTSLTAEGAWRLHFFGTTENSGDAADSEDSDKDGHSNTMERAFRTSPIDAGSRYQPAVALHEDAGKRYPEIRYIRIRGGTGTTGVDYTAEGLVYTVEISGDLVGGSWNSGASVVQPVGDPVIDPDGLTETVTVRGTTPLGDSAGEDPSQFMWLKVSNLP